jgi:hypothetical protein
MLLFSRARTNHEVSAFSQTFTRTSLTLLG